VGNKLWIELKKTTGCSEGKGLVRKNPEKPKKVNVDLTGHTYDGRCKRLVTIDVLVFVVLDIDTGL